MELLAVDLAGMWSEWILPLIMFLVGLGAVVFVHELGHFLMAKWVGIRVEVFSVGMGPRVCGFRGKETDYRISLVPIGGYIKMTGQEDIAPVKEGDTDPRSFSNKSVGARFAVIAAGVVMNVIFAGIAFVAIGLIGIRFDAPVVGGTLPGMPAAEAEITWDDGEIDKGGLKPGDTILSINGKSIQGFQQIHMAAVLANRDSEFKFRIRRADAEGKERFGEAAIGVRFSGTGGSLALAFGIRQTFDLVFAKDSDLILPEDGISAGDRIVGINGEPIRHPWELPSIEKSLTGEPVTVTLRRAGGAPEDTYTVRMLPSLFMGGDAIFLKNGELLRAKETEWDYSDRKNPKIDLTLADGQQKTISPDDLTKVQMDVIGVQPRMTVKGVYRGSPADDAGLRPGDIIAGYGGRGPPTLAEFLEINEEFAEEGTQIIVERDGKTIEPMHIRPKKKRGGVLVGTVPGIDTQSLVIADVRSGSAAEQAGILSSDLITHVNSEAVGTWLELIDALAEVQRSGSAVVLTVQRGAHSLDLDLGVIPEQQFQRSDYELILFAGPREFKVLRSPLIKYANPLSAIAWGIDQTLDNLRMGYMQFPSLFKGNVSVKEVQGPVGIGGIAIRAARKGVVDFVYLMALISVLLAVINFLPFPVVDGGHAVLLIVEKIRGKPLSPRIMNTIQLVGLVFLLGLFIVITYRDIMRLVSDMW